MGAINGILMGVYAVVSRHSASFTILIFKVQDFGYLELSPMSKMIKFVSFTSRTVIQYLLIMFNQISTHALMYT